MNGCAFTPQGLGARGDRSAILALQSIAGDEKQTVRRQVRDAISNLEALSQLLVEPSLLRGGSLTERFRGWDIEPWLERLFKGPQRRKFLRVCLYAWLGAITLGFITRDLLGASKTVVVVSVIAGAVSGIILELLPDEDE